MKTFGMKINDSRLNTVSTT